MTVVYRSVNVASISEEANFFLLNLNSYTDLMGDFEDK